ncbi:Chromosome-associated kinesin KIF4 [Dissostichus eleginoides]|uniref:Chromosome-associated kinesin KIF4 n=1 Tax=Dissostichus eleginoides TaxID=100907 RepID=A0AAD9C344_DISEL|nr:Chromosome-associated kinesin KIF4 [Dissostichus eleginoides]
MRHSDSGHKCWVLTLNHFSNVNQRMEESVKKHAPLHRDLGKTQMKRDAEAIDLALQWFEENNPFDLDRDKELLVSFSTGFRSTGDDPVNAETAAEIGREMENKLDGQSVTSTMEVKSKVQALSSLRKIPKINEKKIHLDSLKLFNRLIIFAQRDMTVETSLAYELTPFPLSLFSNKDQKLNKANKAGFSKTSLKELTDPLDLTNQSCSTLVVDGGWLLYMVKWEQGQTWQEIANSYLSYVQCLGRRSQKTIVVFDGYSRSPKDHDHIRRTKKSCCDLQIRPDMIHWTPRAKFLDNTNNKSELIHLLFSTFRKHNITVEQCDNDADTSIVREALATATDDSVEVRAEDADVLVMLVHHIPSTNHPLFFTTSKGSYDVRRIRKAFSERERCYLLFCHAFTGCDTVSAIAGQSMSLNPSDYGWTLGIHGYEPVPTLDPVAPEELLQFTSCNCNGDCSNRRCSCKRNGVKCISACGVCKGISCKNCGHDGGESGEDSEIDS